MEECHAGSLVTCVHLRADAAQCLQQVSLRTTLLEGPPTEDSSTANAAGNVLGLCADQDMDALAQLNRGADSEISQYVGQGPCARVKRRFREDAMCVQEKRVRHRHA